MELDHLVKTSGSKRGGLYLKITIHLAELRKKLGLYGREVAARSGVSISTIERIEAGTIIPRLDTMCRLALALDVSLDDLVSYARE